jgi:hypothetical protein
VVMVRPARARPLGRQHWLQAPPLLVRRIMASHLSYMSAAIQTFTPLQTRLADHRIGCESFLQERLRAPIAAAHFLHHPDYSGRVRVDPFPPTGNSEQLWVLWNVKV